MATAWLRILFTSALASRDIQFSGLFRLLGSPLGLGALLEYCAPPRVPGHVVPHAETVFQPVRSGIKRLLLSHLRSHRNYDPSSLFGKI